MGELMDLHVYTNNTPEARDKISYLCEIAAEKGMRAVAFTDRINVSRYSDFDLKRRVLHAFFDISKAKQMFEGTLTVYAGIELLQAYTAPDEVKKIVSSQHFDVVLSRVAENGAGEPYALSPDISAEDFSAFAAEYCAQLLKTVNETDLDVLSAPLAPLRGTRCDYAVLEDGLRPVLEALAHQRRALEVDTKDLLGSERIRDLYLRLLVYFRRCGGEYITFGSECFTHDELGAGMDLAMIAARRAGFSQYTYFEKRVPQLLSL